MKKVWETKNPKKKSTKLTPAKKAAAKARQKPVEDFQDDDLGDTPF